jgi:hypothetical protein
MGRPSGGSPTSEDAMRVMVFVKATEDSESGMVVDAATMKMFEDMGRFNEALIKAGIMLDGDGLRPSSEGKRVAFNGAGRTVTDGPFAETRELVAGYWIWQVKDMAEAVEWVKRCPNPMRGPSEIEIRPFFEASDFEGLLTPEVEATHDKNREALGGH